MNESQKLKLTVGLEKSNTEQKTSTTFKSKDVSRFEPMDITFSHG